VVERILPTHSAVDSLFHSTGDLVDDTRRAISRRGKTVKKLVEVSYVKDVAKRRAYLIEAGPEVSVIRFVHNDAVQAISNEFLVEVKKALDL
jgi:hypothetical protein